MAKFASIITLSLALAVCYASGDSKMRRAGVVATNVGPCVALRGLQKKEDGDEGGWNQKEKPQWWDEVEDFEDEFETLKVCERKEEAPEEGSSCAWHDKTCFFDTQHCESVDFDHPKYECTCSGGSDWENPGTWHCMPVSCPEDDTDEAFERSSPTTKPDCGDVDDGKGKRNSGKKGKSGSGDGKGKSGKKGRRVLTGDDDDEDYDAECSKGKSSKVGKNGKDGKKGSSGDDGKGKSGKKG